MSSPIEYLKGVGPLRADLLKKELNLFSFADLLQHFPLRHIDKTQVEAIRNINQFTDYVQVSGRLVSKEMLGEKRTKRLVAVLKDDSGSINMVWFQGINWVEKLLEPGREYLVFGRSGFFQGIPQLTHPEIELNDASRPEGRSFMEPVYPTTEKLKARGLGGRQLAKLTWALLSAMQERDLPENLPSSILTRLNLVSRYTAYANIHFPPDTAAYQQAVARLKFEELFLSQLRMGLLRLQRHRFSRGIIFSQVGDHFNNFFREHLPFQLTNAQKRVLKEIRNDTAHGRQMNRLLQGDVGSGKTIVALLTMLLAIDNGYQALLMAPTEILATQHFKNISEALQHMPIPVRKLTGSTKVAARREIITGLADGELPLVIGTHALIEEKVAFRNLGIAIIDEQHRFGVAQRARMWQKAEVPPHVLVMTATPIPRTLAMTAYGDLDTSIIDELPPGRKPITTVHRLDDNRSRVMDFLKGEIAKGRQAYIIFPLIEESDKMDYENLMKGYEHVKAYFPEPAYWISMVHGRQPAAQKATNMQRFVKGETQIMVSTTVIEVGVNVPNASVMVIESAEKFGLSQLHQLRGRVGRGSEQSFCILLTGPKLSAEARQRMKIMVATNDGFKIAEKDLELRGPGEIEGTRQSGVLNFRLANLVTDKDLVEVARNMAASILDTDPELTIPDNAALKTFLQLQKGKTAWSKIS